MTFCDFCGREHRPTEHCTGGWTGPSYPTCPGCEEETSNDAGWCEACSTFPGEWKLIPLDQFTVTIGDPLRRAA